MTLTLMSLGIEAGHAALDPSLPEPLLQQGTLPPEEADGPFRAWTRRKKYFLVIAVSQTDVPKTDLPFAQVDGHRVVKALKGLGYLPLDPAHPLLTWKAATPSITANATSTQWYDDGSPKTASKPLSTSSRLYRVYIAPAHP